jgi:hypothetical protein
MKPADFWLSFNLGHELSIAGAFIYNGLRGFHELRQLEYTDDVFEFYYSLSVGLERLLKIAVVLLEHNESIDQDALEKSLITHNHLELLARIRKHKDLNLSVPHHDMLSILSVFYKSQRYGRFSLDSVYKLSQERNALCDFLGKHLGVDLAGNSQILGTPNDNQYRKFIRKIVLKISGNLYKVIRDRASALNIYTHELRSGSKAETVFLCEADMPAKDVLWKELLIFFMNTKSSSGYLEFLRSIKPLEFDSELTGDYLDCFQADENKTLVMGELETLYEDLPSKGERLSMMSIINNPNVYFDSPETDEECDD